MPKYISPIYPAELDWQHIDGVDIPISKQFGDVYFSKANGLLETRHVFLAGNDLAQRLAQLKASEHFCVGETGFGTGLNFLALWQLWQQVRPDNQSHLHFISVEKYPLTLVDLKRALAVWHELAPLSAQLIAQYPLPLAGCHRLIFAQERISIDLWLGDAAQCFPMMTSQRPVNAWFLDGFAPSCNPELWQTEIFQHIMRLSGQGTTFSSFSVAGVLKRALKSYGVSITRPRGFGYKREMLKAVWNTQDTFAPSISITDQASNATAVVTQQNDVTTSANLADFPQHVAVIGAGIAGLNCAWALAQRGIPVTLFEQQHALHGGSGNPVALLNPKLCALTQTATHLMTVSWQFALRFYQQFTAFRPLEITQFALKNFEQAEQLAAEYPDFILSWQAENSTHLHHAGAVIPQQFAEQVLAHPLINLKIAKIDQIKFLSQAEQVLIEEKEKTYIASHVIICNALDLNRLYPQSTPLKPIRGQVSWVDLDAQMLEPSKAWSYGGYALPLTPSKLVFGASFHPDQIATETTDADHQHNLALMQQALPDLATSLPDIHTWQGRASLRAQTPDYLPFVGRLNAEQPHVYTLSGLGSKGFLFAPLCAQIIASQLMGEPSPVPHVLIDQLNPMRFKKKVKVKKPYFSKKDDNNNQP